MVTIHEPKNLLIESNTINATALIIIYKAGLKYRCTAFAISKKGRLYRFLTSSHCVANIYSVDMVEINAEKIHVYTIGLFRREKAYYSASVVGAGYYNGHDDYAILEVELENEDTPVLTLSSKEPTVGQCLFNVSFPNDADGNMFYTKIEKITIGLGQVQHIPKHGKNWGGSSGSALVDCYTGEVMAVWSGFLGNGHHVAQPISRFKKFQKEIEMGTYKYPQKRLK